MKKVIILTFSLFFYQFAFCQVQELEDVTIEMLKETSSSIDSTAAAEVMYEKGTITFSIIDSWEYDYEVIRRIKIFNKEGYSQANVQIPYYVGNSNKERELVSRIKGYVYFEKDGKIEKEKLKKKDIFQVDLSELWEAKKMTLPKVQDGVILEYSYSIRSPHISNLPVWGFQNEIPTRYSEYETKVPSEYLAYNLKSKGYYQFQTIKETKEGTIFTKSAGSQLRTMINYTQHVGNNLPKIKTESYVNNISNYLPSIGYELSSYKNGKNGANTFVSKSWEDVVSTLSDTDTYKKELYRTKYFEDELEKLTESISDPKDKMIKIFSFLKSKMTWNGEERRYTSDKLNKIYKEQVGNSADINIILTAMLREAGLDANPVLSSTISNGIPLFPTVSGFNYVFSHVTINGKTYFLDATDEFSFPNVLPKRLLNWSGTMITETGFQSIDLMPKISSQKKYQVQASINEAAEVNGLCRIFSTDYFGLETRSILNKKSNDELKLRYEGNYSLNTIDDITLRNLNDLNKPLQELFSFSGKGEFAEKIGDKIYVSPMLFLSYKENPFKEEERLYPIDYNYPKNIEHFISINIPEGYTVDYMPEKAILKFNDNTLSLTYLVENLNNIITVKVKQEVNSVLFLPEDYKYLREFYINLINKENEKIVLVKS